MRQISLLILFFASTAYAQRPGDGSSFARIAAPFIDEHTLVVVRVDVSGLDVDNILKLAVPIIGDDDEGSKKAAAARRWVKEFMRLGGKDVFFTYGAGDFPHVPVLCVSAPEREPARQALAENLMLIFEAAGNDAQWATLHGCVCVGTKDALAVVKDRKPVDRPELRAAIENGRYGVAQVAFALSAEAKKIHEQVAPTLPAELGGGAIQKVTRGMKWMALTIGSGPKLPAKLITEATSHDAARDLKAVESRAQQAALLRLLKGQGETDVAFRKRIRSLFENHRTTVEGTRITTEWEIATTWLEAVKIPEGAPAERIRSANNLKQLMLALHNYHDAIGNFPTDVRDKDGKPLLSWRVQILPFIEQDHLYRQFKLNEPWDSEHNRKLVAQMPKVFRSPRQADNLKEKTTYLAPLGKGFMWDEPKGLKVFQITDGTSNTIAIVEADDERAVTWTKPEDITIDMRNPLTGLLGHYTEGFHAALADGSVRIIKKSIDPKMLWALFTRDGGEVVGFPK
jgi:hypothetical protein